MNTLEDRKKVGVRDWYRLGRTTPLCRRRLDLGFGVRIRLEEGDGRGTMMAISVERKMVEVEAVTAGCANDLFLSGAAAFLGRSC